MTQGSKLADRLVGRIFGKKDPLPREEPTKPVSVKKRLDDMQEVRRAMRARMRPLGRIF